MHTVFSPWYLAVVGKDFTKQNVLCPCYSKQLNYRASWLLAREVGEERASCLHFSSHVTKLLLIDPHPHLLHPLLFLPPYLSKAKNIKIKNRELLALN